MKISIQEQIGKSFLTFEVDGDTLKEALAAASFYTSRLNTPKKCALCESEDLVLTSYTTKEEGFLYVKIRCNACNAASTLGEGKDKKNFWWKDFEKFEKNSQTVPPTNSESTPVAEEASPVTEAVSSGDGDPLKDLPF